MKQETLNQINAPYAPSQTQLDALVDDANDISNHECKCQLSTLLQARVYELETRIRELEYNLEEALEDDEISLG